MGRYKPRYGLSGAVVSTLWDCWRRKKLAGQGLESFDAYEDTGLEPEEIGKAMSDRAEVVIKYRLAIRDINEMGGIDHLRELARAKRDGRLVVLPCKVGDYLHVLVRRGFVSLFVCTAVEVLQDGNVFVRWRLEHGITGLHRTDGTDAREFGETVFLTREEAEAALAGGAG